MKTFKTLLLGLCIVMCACSTQTPRQTNEYGTNWQWENGTIVIETPERPAGQKSVLGLTVPKMEVVRVGFVGLGMRGPGFLILLFNFRLRILVFKTPDWCVICDRVYKNNKINRLWLI